MALFISTYINKVDKKGRVSVPANFRTAIRKQNFQGIIIYYSFINECIEACDLQRIELLSMSIDNLDPYSEERDALATSILGGSVQLAFDMDGRVMLPNELIELAHISDKATFVGKGATFEIWNPEKFSLHASKARDIAKREKGKLQLSINHSKSKLS